jgi:hypothetical protein
MPPPSTLVTLTSPTTSQTPGKDRKVAPGAEKRRQEEKENLVGNNGAGREVRPEGKKDHGKASKGGQAAGEEDKAQVVRELDVVKESVGMVIGKKVREWSPRSLPVAHCVVRLECVLCRVTF